MKRKASTSKNSFIASLPKATLPEDTLTCIQEVAAQTRCVIYNYIFFSGKTCLYNATNSGANLTSWVDIPHKSEAVS